MKRHLLRAMSLMFCLEVSQLALASPPPAVHAHFLEVKTDGGMVPDSRGGWEEGVRIFASGKMQAFSKHNATSPTQTSELGHLSPTVMAFLKGQVSRLVDAPLVFPDIFPCADAPDTTFTAIVKDARIVFAKNTECRTGYLKNSSEAARLSTVLRSIQQLHGAMQ